jgi:hypothetical protein
MKWSIPAFVVFYFLFVGCSEFDEHPDVKPEKLSQLRGEFQFTIDPALEQATGLGRFSMSANSMGVKLPDARFFFDGKEVLPDSTEMNGVFYEMQLPVADFFREHTIELRTADASSLERFTPVLFVLYPGFRDVSQNESLSFGVQGVPDDEIVIVSLIDTSFTNNDLVKKIPVRNSQLVVDTADLRQLAHGPIAASVVFEKKEALTKLGLRRAFLVIRQGVSGEFLLK